MIGDAGMPIPPGVEIIDLAVTAGVPTFRQVLVEDGFQIRIGQQHGFGGQQAVELVALVDADQISREILLPGSPLLPVLAQRFGADILYADGSLNRRLLADRAFAAPEGKAALDSLVLPEIIRRVCRLKQAAREAGAPLFVIDGAVIVGTDAEKECDHLCVVTAPFATSVARIAARDGIAPEMAARRLNAQTPEEVLLARADLVLRNDADLASLEAAAAALCEQLQAEGARKGGADTSL